MFKLDRVIFELEFIETLRRAELRDCSATAWLSNLLRNFQYLRFTTIDYQFLSLVELMSAILGIESVNQVLTFLLLSFNNRAIAGF